MIRQSKRLQIRPARPADASLLAKFRYVFRAEGERVIEPKTRFVGRCQRWMKKRISAKQFWRCWIAENRSGVVGTIWVELIEKIPNPVSEAETHAYITNFYVVPDARGQRVGARLLRAALTWCQTQKVDAVILWPSKRSRTIYLRHGFAVPDNLLELGSQRRSNSARDRTKLKRTGK